ncbi:DoxX family protein [Microbacterium aquimaris]|uniref:DoxX family membrane protein n=1 Tax=Microbacterium aquimaris TaxID=459816 RepID=A0ABU5N8R1_9MICO|nr:hypothetical protein [Microbacterium aquimaris]MDZ8162426.1 hypothetical protein [Microbacterium aquimaris]
MEIARTVARIALSIFLIFAGAAHLTFARADFLAQVPGWVPLPTDVVVVVSGIVEIALGAALALWTHRRTEVGWTTAAFFIAVFPGNVAQFVDGVDAFGLNSDLARGVRLLFQPLLVLWALWSTAAWRQWRRRRRSDVGGRS